MNVAIAIRRSCNSFYFYIKPQPSFRLKAFVSGCNSFYFYIKPQPSIVLGLISFGCNSFYFYIKPQRITLGEYIILAVIHSISTSNHNS